MSSIQVLILMGSDSDLPVMQGTADLLEEFGIAAEMTVASAHRSPHRVERLLADAERRGVQVFIAGQLPPEPPGEGAMYMVMEYLDGEPLSMRIQGRGRMSPSEIAPLAVQVVEGLAAAHSAGIIHRDLKPDNIYILREKAGIAVVVV